MEPAGGWPTNGYVVRGIKRPVTDIQNELIELGFLPEGSADGAYGPQTSQAVAKFQQTRWLTADGIYGEASDGTLFPPEGSTFGADYSFARPDLDLLYSRGVRFLFRYLFQLTWSQGISKGLSNAEYDAIIDAGIDVPAYLYEEAATDIISGFAVGAEQARRAEAHRLREGLPEKPIIFNVDRSIHELEFPGVIEGLKGAASVVGFDRVWLYGGYPIVRAAFDAGVIANAFQTYAWSGGNWDPRAEYHQWANGQDWDGLIDFCRKVVVDRTENE